MAEQKTEEKVRKKVRSLEERRQATQDKLEEMDRKLASRKVRTFWRSNFRKLKSELNHNKELDFVGKVQKFVDRVYEETGILASYEDDEDRYDDEDESEDLEEE